MKYLLIAGFLIFPTLSLAIDTYDPVTGMIHMPNVSVDSNNYEVYMTRRKGLVFEVTSKSLIIFPEKFSMQWLNGKTLYVVWYGEGEDNHGDPIYDVPVVVEEFFDNGTIHYTGLLNMGSGNVSYDVDAKGRLYYDGNLSETNRICGNTSQYLITHYEVNDQFDNVDIFFFNKEDALNAAKLLGGQIPRCP